MRKGVNLLLILFFVFSSFILFTSPADAIPVFARKYKVSCMQCHISIFRRNEFGDAFRRNGYQWPEGKDENATVEEPIPLPGNSIGVGAIPETIPFAVYGHQRITWDTSDSKKDKAQFDPHELELLTGGTIGKDISFFGEWLIWEKGKTDADRLGELWFMLDNLYGRALNIKIGRMTQTLSLYKENDRLTLNHLITNEYKIKNFKLSGKRHGVEINGIIADRIDYALGIGDNNNNWTDENYKDFYYHIGWRPTGMTFTGIDPDVDLDNPSIFDFPTITLSHYGYFGTELIEATTKQVADLTDGSISTVEDTGEYRNKIKRFGFDAELNFKKITFQNGVVLGWDDNQDGANTEVKSYAFFNELNYRIKSWLIMVYRYEHSDSDLSSASITKNHNPSLIYLFRENIRISFEALIKDDSEDNETYKFNILYAF